MNSENHHSPDLRIPRRTFIRRAAALTGATAVLGAIPRKAFAADSKPTLVNSIRSLSNPYHATWNQGGADFAKSVGCEYVTLVTEGNSEKGIADVRAIVAKTGG
jgi:ribose transport system substrate-binding protein